MVFETARVRLSGWWQTMRREQKISVSILLVVSVITVILSILHMRAQLFAPFMVSKAILKKSDDVYYNRLREDEVRLAEQRIKDTDRDGLTDYSELYIYKTSAYLADTDSDSIPDSVEIARGTNPLCAEGKECRATEAAVLGSSTTTYADLLVTTETPRAAAEITTPAASNPAGVQGFVDQPLPPDQMTPAQIREYLVSHGLVQPAQITGLSDTMVTQVYAAAYQEALRVQQASRGAVRSSSTTP